jgi:hypothetical protein
VSPDTGASVQIVAVVCASSALAFAVGRKAARLPPRGLRFAAAQTLECMGLAVVFHAANVALGVCFALLSRAAGSFASLYTSGDVSLAVFSLLQALLFQWWRRSG